MMKLVFVISLVFLPLTSVFGDCDFNDFPTTDQMLINTIAPAMNWNGQQMAIKSFVADLSVEQVIRYYHRQWRDAFADSQSGAWLQVANLNEDCMKLVQVAEDGRGGSIGRLAIIFKPPSKKDDRFGDGVIKPIDALVVSDMHNSDGPKKNRLTVITNHSDVATTTLFYRNTFSDRGWLLSQEFNQAQGTVLTFKHGTAEANVLIAPAGQATQVMLSVTEIQ